MQVFGDNPDRFVDGFSEEFEEQFMEHLKRSHRSSRVAATVVWNEYIANRHHIHMNSTKWATLTGTHPASTFCVSFCAFSTRLSFNSSILDHGDLEFDGVVIVPGAEFVKYLGRAGKCKVDETPKGWFITFIDREPETLLRENLKNKRDRAELADEERHEKALAEQIERAAKNSKPDQEQLEPEKTELVKQEGEKIGFALGSSKQKPRAEGLPPLHNSGSNMRSSKISVFGGGMYCTLGSFFFQIFLCTVYPPFLQFYLGQSFEIPFSSWRSIDISILVCRRGRRRNQSKQKGKERLKRKGRER